MEIERRIKCKLVAGTLKDEYIAFYPPDKPKATAVVRLEEIEGFQLTPEGPVGYVKYEQDSKGFGKFLDERANRFTPRNKDIRRTYGEVRDGSDSAKNLEGREANSGASQQV